MANLNKVFLIGNLTRDPELKYTPSGAAVCKFGIASNEKFKDSEGNLKERPCFVDVDAWGKQAENANEYLKKGKLVMIEGKLEYQTWDAQDGTKRSKLTVRADNIQYLSAPSQNGQEQPQSDGDASPSDIPF